jgi:phospholipid/cholesterol/gamma-HCH transport system substrate-binding protein
VATLTILAAGVFLIGSRQSLFTSTYRVNATFHNVVGLNEDADVRVGGLNEGRVKHIQLPNRPDGDVTVSIDLRSGTKAVVKEDSMASIKSDGLVGDKYVEISFGSNDGPPIKNNDTIRSEPPVDISDLVKKANGLLASANTAVEDLNKVANNAQAISGKINQGQGTLGALVNDKTVYNQAVAGTAALNEDMEALKHNFFLRGFFKKRGYEDSTDLTKNTVPRLPPGEPIKTFEYEGRTIFAKPDVAKLKNEKELREAGAYLQQNNFGLAVVVASAGMKGEASKDKTLTEGRATAIRDYLAKNFRLDDTRIKTLGLGKMEDVPDDGVVQILVYPASGTRAAVEK